MNIKTNRKRNAVLVCLGITAAYWVLILLGPGLVVLFNNITLWFSGGGFYEGSFGYKLLVFFSQPFACYLAYSAAESISEDEHSICVLVNEIVAICIFILLTFSAFFLLGEPLNAISYIVSAIATIISAVYTSKTLSNIIQKHSEIEEPPITKATLFSSEPQTVPVEETLSIEECEEIAFEMGVSVEIALKLINYDRAQKGLPPLTVEEYE